MLDSKGMPDKWKTSVAVPIFKKGDVMNCGACRGVKLLVHSKKIVKRCWREEYEH